MNDPAITPPAAPPETKRLFQSKTAIAQAITIGAGALSFGSDEVHKFLALHAGTILLGLGIANLVLRRVTHERWSLY